VYGWLDTGEVIGGRVVLYKRNQVQAVINTSADLTAIATCPHACANHEAGKEHREMAMMSSNTERIRMHRLSPNRGQSLLGDGTEPARHDHTKTMNEFKSRRLGPMSDMVVSCRHQYQAVSSRAQNLGISTI
jgi:hypothetical protein